MRRLTPRPALVNQRLIHVPRAPNIFCLKSMLRDSLSAAVLRIFGLAFVPGSKSWKPRCPQGQPLTGTVPFRLDVKFQWIQWNVIKSGGTGARAAQGMQPVTVAQMTESPQQQSAVPITGLRKKFNGPGHYNRPQS